MVEFLQPLQLETWFINVFSGNPDIFGAIALFAISSMAAYFRMNTISLFMMLGIFFLMFSGYIGINFLVLFAILGGLLAGVVISKLIS